MIPNKLMIRKFSVLCKINFIKNSDLSIFHSIYDTFSVDQEVCPFCHTKHSCTKHATYQRDFIVLEAGNPALHKVSITRVICSSCGHSHAILPDILIPYGSYSLFLILKVLRQYFLRTVSVEALCASFQISISTLYTWLRLFRQHKVLWLGVVNDAATSSLSFIDKLLDSSSFTQDFFECFAFSFLQSHQRKARSSLP